MSDIRVNNPWLDKTLLNDLLLSGPDGLGPKGVIPPAGYEKLLDDLPKDLQLPKLPSPLRMMGGLSLEVLVEALTNEERKTATETGLQNLKAKAQEQKEINDKKLEEIEERLKKLESKKGLNIFMKIFKILALVVSAIATVATVAVGVMTGNPLLVAAGVAMAALVVDSIISEATDGKVSIAAGVTALAEACGADEETAKWIGFGVTIGLTVVAAGLSFGAGFASGASKLTADGMNLCMKIIITSSKITNFAGGFLAVGTGAGTIAGGVLDYQIQNSWADTKELEAILERIRAAVETEEDFLKIILQKYQDLMGKLSDIIEDNNQAQTQILGGDFSQPPLA